MNITVTHNDAFPLASLPPDEHLVGRAMAEVRAMAVSLKEVQIEAIVVVQFGAGEHPQDSAYDVLCGTCRVKAARLNGMPALRADIWQSLTWGEFVRLRSVANSRRSRNPLADVEAMREMVKLGLTCTEMARLLEKTPAEVKQLLGYLNVPPEVLQGARDNRVAQGVLAQVAKLGPARQQAAVQVLQQTGRLRSSDLTGINRAARRQASLQIQVVVPALQVPARPTLTALMARLVREQDIDLKGNGHPPTAQALWLSPEDLAELQRLLPEARPASRA